MYNPETKQHLDYLDGWRGVAIALVLIGHFFHFGFVELGKFGVEFFFVLSGRLMAEILFIRQTSLKTFIPRRINRVYPALFVYVVIVAALAQFSETFAVGPKAVVAALMFLWDYVLAIPFLYRTEMFDHFWSLSVEEHSYLLLALIAFFFRKNLRLAAFVILAVALLSFANGFVSYSVLDQGYFDTYWRFDVHVGSIFISTALYCFQKLNILPSTALLFWPSLIGAFVLSMSALPMPLHYSAATVCLALAICNIDNAKVATRLLSARPIRALGLISYSLYLWQQPFYQLTTYDMLSVWLALPLAIICAYASYRLIEKPARSYLNEAWDAFQTKRAARQAGEEQSELA